MKTVVGRTLAILELLAHSKGTTPQAVATATDLPASTIYRYFSILVEQEFARREDGLYVPGRRLNAISLGRTDYGEFASLVQEDLEAFQRDSELTVFLCVREGAYAVAVKVIESTQRLKLAMAAGDTLPLYASAPAKVHLAFSHAAFQSAYIATTDLKRLASNTITSPEALRKEIRLVRERGYATSVSEVDEMASAIAFPILDLDEVAAFSLCISGPSGRFEGQLNQDLLKLGRRYAAVIAEKFSRYQDAHRPAGSNGVRHANRHP